MGAREIKNEEKISLF